MSLENIYLTKAVNLNSKIDGYALRQLLLLEDQKFFDSQLVSELIFYFGDRNTVNFKNFEEIWEHLSERRQDFYQFAVNGQLGENDFKMLLEHMIQKQLQTEFIRMLINYYGRTITFDTYVHAVHHVQNITSSDMPLSPNILMQRFRESVRTTTEAAEIEPSAPPEEIVY